MLMTRVIPVLLLKNGALVKTVKFGRHSYIGDPVNAIRIYNELEVDELVFLDIMASQGQKSINYELLRKIADECFMPLCYGGGVSHINEIGKILELGFEKISLNTWALKDPNLITKAAQKYGSQSIVVSIDIRSGLFGKRRVYTRASTKNPGDPLTWAKNAETSGAGEILLNSVDRDGTWSGYDIDLITEITANLSIPVIALGGAGSLQDLSDAVVKGGASAVAAGSMFVYQKKGMGVLINYPSKNQLKDFLN